MIGILDYGFANIRSYCNVFNEQNIKTRIIREEIDFDKSLRKVILPGIGSFDSAMHSLHSSKFFDAIQNFTQNKNHLLLGVCVGMQILTKSSEEGSENGLDLVPGKIIKFKTKFLPHMGWNSVEHNNDPLFLGIKKESLFYFLHSFHYSYENKKNCIAQTSFENNFISSFKFNNIYGVQFHPEKSHNNGKILLKNFYKL